jgi:hypothetical protein
MTASHAYVGRAKCRHVYFLCVDDGAKDNGKSGAGVIRKGGTIERISIEAAHAAARDAWCICTRKQRWEGK